MDEASEVNGTTVVAGGEAAKMLEATEASLEHYVVDWQIYQERRSAALEWQILDN